MPTHDPTDPADAHQPTSADSHPGPGSTPEIASAHARAQRPATAPDFLLSSHEGSLLAQGAHASFADPDAATHHLRAWARDHAADDKAARQECLVGALPFLPYRPAALTHPVTVRRSEGPLEPPAYYRGQRLHTEITGYTPSRPEHFHRLTRAIEELRRVAERKDAETEHAATKGTTAARAEIALDKVVLARAVHLTPVAPETVIDPLVLAARLIDDSPDSLGFLADLSPAGGEFRGRTLVGSSPELLVSRRGTEVRSFPLAGSIPRGRTPEEDAARAEELAASAKNAAEHAFVVDAIREALTPLCVELDVPALPELRRTAEMWHLGTPIRGRLSSLDHTALDLARLLHPTPAIGGTPTDEALTTIARLEGADARGFYAGTVGYVDAHGDGQWMVTIRCAEVSAEWSTARAWAGGGIVAASDPAEELAETDAKIGTILRALGCAPDTTGV